MLADRRYCYPLTITDFASRYLIACEALQSTKEAYAFTVFENAFKEFGLPNAIRTDNGVPFASPNALFNLSRLSVWWLRLGITIERMRIRPEPVLPANTKPMWVCRGSNRSSCMCDVAGPA